MPSTPLNRSAVGERDEAAPEDIIDAFTVAAVAVCIRHRVHHCFMRWTEETSACTTIAFGHLQDFFVSLMSGNSAFYPWHSPCISSMISSNAKRRKEASASDDECQPWKAESTCLPNGPTRVTCDGADG